MIVLVFLSFFLVTTFGLFSFSLKTNKVNRAIIYTPLEIFTTSIPLTELEEGEAYYKKEEISKLLLSYYDKEIKPVMEDYTMSTFYYTKDDHSICIEEKCDAVEVTIKGTINGIYPYQRTMYYEIRWVNSHE